MLRSPIVRGTPREIITIKRTRNQPKTGGVATVAATLGFVAGLRSQLPLALLATAANGGQFVRTSGKPLGLLRSRGALGILALAAIGELIVDKLPFTPSRLNRSSLTGRVVIGGIAGSAILHDAGRSAPIGAMLGAAGAGAGSFAGYYARKTLVHATGFPDFVWAATEDALALSLGLLAIRRYFRA